MNKRAISYVVLLIVVLSVGIAAAAETIACDGGKDSNQTILRLNSQSNAHGANWNEGAYTTQICYDDLFETRYDQGNAHDCSSSDGVISLSSTINAHGAEYNFAYPIKICHMGLSDCKILANSDANLCYTLNMSAVVYLAKLNNSHLRAIYSPSYDYVVCCKGKSNAIPPAPKPQSCADYDRASAYPSWWGKANCTTDTNQVSQSASCPKGVCYCNWSDSYASGAKCYQAYHVDDPVKPCIAECQISPGGETDCIDGVKTLSVNAKLVGLNPLNCVATDPECATRSVSIPCGVSVAELPFFGLWQFTTALAGVIFVYFLARARKS